MHVLSALLRFAWLAHFHIFLGGGLWPGCHGDLLTAEGIAQLPPRLLHIWHLPSILQLA